MKINSFQKVGLLLRSSSNEVKTPNLIIAIAFPLKNAELPFPEIYNVGCKGRSSSTRKDHIPPKSYLLSSECSEGKSPNLDPFSGLWSGKPTASCPLKLMCIIRELSCCDIWISKGCFEARLLLPEERSRETHLTRSEVHTTVIVLMCTIVVVLYVVFATSVKRYIQATVIQTRFGACTNRQGGVVPQNYEWSTLDRYNF